jgi:NADPH:quinone reductase-like Zn-dependent oxidoreductase
MKAMQVTPSNSELTLTAAEVPTPTPSGKELLIRVHAAGVTPTELLWYPTTHTIDGKERKHAIPGHEFSGTVYAISSEVTGFSIGDEVFGMSDWFLDGATAEYCLATPQGLAHKPNNLTHELAATVPIAALTAWQGLIDRAKLQPGERVLVHGAAGSVGIFAVQLAHQHKAHVIATASAHNIDFVQQLGADEVLDYKRAPFESVASNIDVVFDAVGGDTFERSIQVLSPTGRIITIASDAEGNADPRIKDAFFIVEPNQKHLTEIAWQLQQGLLRTFINAAVLFEQAPQAYANQLTNKRGYGKVVISIA